MAAASASASASSSSVAFTSQRWTAFGGRPRGGIEGESGCRRRRQTEWLSMTRELSTLRSLGQLGGIKKERRGVTRADMILTEARPAITKSRLENFSPKALAYELIQGALVRWTETKGKSDLETPTAVLVHGILGARKNWGSFARRLAQEFPSWQFLLVDLRCHGDSSLLTKRGPHSVATAARDILQLVGQLKLTPRVLIGHSFGGKVVLSMVDQAAKPLARPVQVWVLDATPGKVRVGGDGEDSPEELITVLQAMPTLVPSRRAVVDELSARGFSTGISQWMTTNLRAVEGFAGYSWSFDLDGVADMYRSYEDTNLWPMVESQLPEGVHINFLRAERSLHRWHRDDVERIRLAERIASREGAGVQMHVLEDAGHWVHTDNPDGLFKILSSSFRIGSPRLTRL